MEKTDSPLPSPRWSLDMELKGGPTLPSSPVPPCALRRVAHFSLRFSGFSRPPLPSPPLCSRGELGELPRSGTPAAHTAAQFVYCMQIMFDKPERKLNICRRVHEMKPRARICILS